MQMNTSCQLVTSLQMHFKNMSKFQTPDDNMTSYNSMVVIKD